jgi:5-methyltetrahydropteroyltriglutamate--homocysteine methyltransferase
MQNAEANGTRTATYRAEPVGSLLRPAPLKEMFERIFSSHSSHAVQVLDDVEREQLEQLEVLAEEAIRDAVARQISIGLDVITDGEMRRAHYVNSLFDALGGLGENEQPEYFAGGEGVAPPPEPTARQQLSIVDNPLARETAFLRELTDHPSKVTIQAPSSFYFPSSSYDSGVYGSRDEFVGHVVELSRELVGGAVGAGARYVQFDYPLYPALCDEEKRAELVAGLGEDAGSLLSKALAADNAVLEGLPASVTTGLHLCRGNFRSRWWAQGSLEPVAERMFGELRYDRLLVEWEDTEREGDYSALRFVPADGPVVVMGVVSSKVAELEPDEEILRRMDDASRYLDIDRLALSPQCGFASVWYGNELTEDEQWRKLELVTRTANKIWGS